MTVSRPNAAAEETWGVAGWEEHPGPLNLQLFTGLPYSREVGSVEPLCLSLQNRWAQFRLEGKPVGVICSLSVAPAVWKVCTGGVFAHG